MLNSNKPRYTSLESLGLLKTHEKNKCFTFLIGLGTPLHKANGILGELSEGINELNDLVHFSWELKTVDGNF